ncbi:MAG: dihydroorotase family protein [Promethearchaeota archaeon]
MILKNARVYSKGLIHIGAILINDGIINQIKFMPNAQEFKELVKKNQDGKEIDCLNKLVLPGIIDIHSHLRDMDQKEKETFLTGTLAAANSGITTVFNMPNTKPPAITEEQVKLWIIKAKKNIYIDVGFIAGVPKDIDEAEIEKIINLGVIGFKIYPLSPLNDIDWNDNANIQKILLISSKYQIPIFIHAAFPLSITEREHILEKFKTQKQPILELHEQLNPVHTEENYITFIIQNYENIINIKKLNTKKYPIVHFCHVSCIESYLNIQRALNSNENLRITFEVTPHHLLLSNNLNLTNDNYGKVLPPLRTEEHPKFLFNELKEGKIQLIGTDHSPHTLEEKSVEYLKAPSGFPGFETYPLLLLDKVFNFELPLENFVKASSENPAKIFNLKNKGFIKKGYDADLLIVDKISEYKIKSNKFNTRAKFSPFENFKTIVQIWKVFLKGIEINSDNINPNGRIIYRKL